MIKRSLLIMSILLLLSLNASAQPKARSRINMSALEQGFQNIPDTIQTSVYWYWVSGNISHEGVIKDLEAMKKVGINRAFIAHVTWGEKNAGKVRLFTEEWWEILHTAFKTATRLGIEIGIFNCPGWSQSGGPWVKSEQSMRYLTSSELVVNGPQLFQQKLQSPDPVFQDVKVIAYPAPDDYGTDQRDLKIKISSTPALNNLIHLTDRNYNTTLQFPSTDQLQIDLSTDQPYTARSLTINLAPVPSQVAVELQANVRGSFQTIKHLSIDRTNPSLKNGFMPYGPAVISIPATTTKNFRLKFSGYSDKSGITEIRFSSIPLVENYQEKTLAKMWPYGPVSWATYQWAPQPEIDNQKYIIDPEKVVDISKYLSANGTLTWRVPPGRWIIERSGMTSTQMQNVHAEAEGTGLETDKLSRRHITSHFEAFVGEIFRRIPEQDRKTWKVVVLDSYETGSQNWTDQFIEKFSSKYGYSPVPYIPVLQGKIVQSADHSDRFLWDLRRLIADQVAEEYVGGLTQASHQKGLTTWLENYGHYGFPGEFLQYGGHADEVSGEFWNEGIKGILENKAASSCAHIYGKTKVSAESFTTTDNYFLNYPSTLKKRLDRSFAEGINNTLLHVYIHQPYEEKVPGMNAYFGTEFNRKNTWFYEMDDFLKYIKRCNLLLQQGHYVADVAYFISEDAPRMTGIQKPDVPDGYSYDYINAEVIKNRLTVKDGKLLLPDGMQYRLLVLPNLETMRPELLEQIRILVRNGAIISGKRPTHSPSLQQYPKADAKVRQLTNLLWGSINKTGKINHYGKGMVLDGMSVQDALTFLKIIPDFQTKATDSVIFIHRELKDGSIYFISNQNNETIKFKPSFRVSGKMPELWDATTGVVRDLHDYTASVAATTVPLELAAHESTFVIFRKDHLPNQLKSTNYPKSIRTIDITSHWVVSFDPKTGGPTQPVLFKKLEDWIQNTDNRIKYYSGAANYQNGFNLEKISTGERILLDLGNLPGIAKVKINGKAVGGVWTAPYKIDITSAVKPGKNQLDIKIINNWTNRLIGDRNLPEKERITWTYWQSSINNQKLQSSGLTGPVRLQVVKQ